MHGMLLYVTFSSVVVPSSPVSRHHSAGTRIADIEKEHKEVSVHMLIFL